MKCVLFIVLASLTVTTFTADPELEEEELRARAFLHHANSIKRAGIEKLAYANWEFKTNITDTNKKKMLETSAEVAKKSKLLWQEAMTFKWKNYKDGDIKRQFKKYSVLGLAALPDEKFKKFNKIVSDMQEIYSTAKICSFDNLTKCDLALDPDLTNILTTSNDTEELSHIWTSWRNAVGPKVRHFYQDYVTLINKAAKLNHFKDAGEFWLNNYDTPNIKELIENLWEQLKPLYVQIHAYVRYQLRQIYGEIVTEKGPIPAHLLGNMWAQSWESVYAFTKPYPDKESVSVTEEMENQGYDVMKIFKTAEDFFTSLNLSPMPEEFWKKSLFEKPTDREVICHASAHDFMNSRDFRVKQCTEVTEKHLITAHHEMGHIQYYLQYKNQPVVYRQGANEGFHEAIGDVIALSVRTTKHLRKIGLLKSEDDARSELNNLYAIGLSKIVFLPFAYIMDLWRWGVFSGKVSPEDYNCEWWKLVEEYQGLEPPVQRTEDDFDPASKYHIIANVPYLRYFVSFIIQFQFHRSLCIKAHQYNQVDPARPLHKCDLYESAEAGEVFKQMLQMGASRPWQEAMQIVTGQQNMDASGILEYFRPLQIWLEAENTKNNAFIGWESSKKACTKNKKSDSVNDQ